MYERKYIVLLFYFIIQGHLMAQDTTATLPQLNPLDFTQIDFYGSLRAKLAAYNGNLEVQNNSTRIGVALRTYWNKQQKFSLYGRLEWSVNLVENDFEFNLDGTSASGLAKAEKVASKDVFGMRLGFIGLDFEKYGQLTIGKQWGVYYDVAKFTDRYFIFGGSSLGTYVNGTDGGSLGTGRAEKAIQYRLKFSRWAFGAQVQYRGITENSTQGDSYGLSIRYHPENISMSFGVAVNAAKFSTTTAEKLAGFEKDPLSLVAGFCYWKGTKAPSYDSKFYFALSLASLRGSEGIDTDSITVIYDGIGIEGICHFQFYENWSLIGGINFQSPSNLNEMVHPEFKKEQYILGLYHTLSPGAYVYMEGIINNSRSGKGEKAANVLALGLRFNFSSVKERQRLLDYFY